MATLEQQLRRALAPLGRMTGDRRGVQAAVKSLAKEVRKAAAETPPKPLASHLVQNGIGAWAVAPDGGKEVLVKRDSSGQLLDFQGKPITRARSLRSTAGREYRVSYFNELEGLEGLFLDMYLDSESNVTVGLGHLIPSPEEAKKLPFVERGSSKPAHDNHIANAYRKVKRQIDWRGFAHKYVGLTSIQVPRAAVTTLAFDDIDQKLREIRHFFPNFETYPLPAKHALMDMVYNSGIGTVVGKKDFSAAVRIRDWKTAAQKSHRDAASDKRNRLVRDWFLEALKEEPAFVRPRRRIQLKPRVK